MIDSPLTHETRTQVLPLVPICNKQPAAVAHFGLGLVRCVPGKGMNMC